MKKVFKKSLSCLLTAVLCISLFVAAVPASAVTPTYSTNDIEAKAGEAVNIDFTVSNFSNVIGAMIRVNLPSAIGSVESVTLNGEVFDAFDPETGTGYYQTGQEDGVYYVKFISLFGAELGELDSMETLTLNIAATVKEDAAAQVYEYPAPVFSVTEDGETLVDVTGTFGTFEVVEDTPVGPVVDPELVFNTPSLGFASSSLQFTFRVNNTILDKYSNVEVVIIPDKYDTSTLNLVESPSEIVIEKADLTAAGSTRKQYIYTDIQLYELGLDINYMLRAYDAEGNLVAISETFTTSPAEYLKDRIAMPAMTAEFKAVATDVLIVCDESAKRMIASYPDSDLAAAPSVIEGVDLSNATQTVGEYNTVNLFNSYDDSYGTASSYTHQVRTSVEIQKVPVINFLIADEAKALDLNKLSVTVSYTSVDSAGEHPFSETYTGTDAFTYAGKFINLQFAQVGLHDSDKDILFDVTYDGTKVCDLTYSIETYTGSMQDNELIGDLSTALLKLGQSFRAYSESIA